MLVSSLSEVLQDQAVVTRWNSSLRQVKSLLGLDMKLLQDLLKLQGHKHVILSARELAQLNELVDLLEAGSRDNEQNNKK